MDWCLHRQEPANEEQVAFIPGACLGSWQTNVGEWSVEYFWRRSDLVERAIFLGQALMLAYTVFVVIRFSRRYYLARREFRELRRVDPKIVAHLSPGMGMLRGISRAAPFLGLAGTCYGITSAVFFGNVVTGSRRLFEAWIASQIAAILVTTAAGIMVAIPAAFAHNLLIAHVESLSGSRAPRRYRNETNSGSFQFAQNLPLKRQFAAPPHYALLAAPVLASIIVLFMPFHPYRVPTGLSVAIPSGNCDRKRNDRLIVLQVMNTDKLFINFEPVDWKDLSTRLSEIYRSREYREIYLHAEDGVSFQTVADAIDIARNSPAPGPDSLDIRVRLVIPNGARECAPIPVRTIPARAVLR